MVPNAIENDVVTLTALGAFLLGVIDDMIRADGSAWSTFRVLHTAGDIRAERLGDLHRERAHGSRGAARWRRQHDAAVTLSVSDATIRSCWVWQPRTLRTYPPTPTAWS